jgi:ligand-binding SRPBCC domain-containing protein
MVHRFTASQWLPHPVPLVFAYLADPRNLPPLMPTWQKARVDEARMVAPPPAPADAFRTARMRGPYAGAGSLITISFLPLPFSPVRLSWQAAISEFEWNDHFCDVQQSGPFASWTHRHAVKPERRGAIVGTLITDDVSYEMKMGWVGKLAHALYMSGQVRRMFAYRQRRIAEIFDRIGDATAHMAR